MNRKRPTDAQWRRWNAASRDEQIAIVKEHLSRVFDRRHKSAADDESGPNRDRAKNDFVANRMAKYIRQEDNSVRGFPRRFQNFMSPGDREIYLQKELSKMIALSAPLPPQFIGLANYEGGQRFVAIYYQGTKATIADGTVTTTFPYYEAYSPLVDHLAISCCIRQHGGFLGADDGEATHALLLDTEKGKIYLTAQRAADHFLEVQRPQSDEEQRAVDERLEKMFEEFENAKTLGDFQRMGMFQLFAPVRDRSEEINAMTRFLNEHIPKEAQALLSRWAN